MKYDEAIGIGICDLNERWEYLLEQEESLDVEQATKLQIAIRKYVRQHTQGMPVWISRSS